jgi:transposase
VLGRIAVALAGRAGSRLASGLGVPASRRSCCGWSWPASDPEAAYPRVLGVDDFAIRRDQHYGTLLIDIATGAPLGLLEGRDAQPLAGWLAARPGAEIICRDRAGSYADGARTGAPDAVQVAGRCHLWQNLAKAVEKCVAAHRACVAEPAAPAAGNPEPEAEGPANAGPPDPTGKFAGTARRKHELVHRLRAEGRGLREIARHLGWGLHTVQRYDRAVTWQELQAASDQARAFATMITDLTGQDLPQWMATAREAGLPGIASFAKGLEQDLDAVTNGLTMNWSSSPVEAASTTSR